MGKETMTTSEFCAVLHNIVGVDAIGVDGHDPDNGITTDVYDDGTWRMCEPQPGFVFVEIASGRVEMKDGMVVLP